jgi:hypothetical protein
MAKAHCVRFEGGRQARLDQRRNAPVPSAGVDDELRQALSARMEHYALNAQPYQKNRPPPAESL